MSITRISPGPRMSGAVAHGATVYLAGSVHLLPSQDARLPAGFERAYADSACLVMEIDLGRIDQNQVSAWIERHGIVLERARGAVPSLVAAIAGEPVRGSWWGIPRGAGSSSSSAQCRTRRTCSAAL